MISTFKVSNINLSQFIILLHNLDCGWILTVWNLKCNLKFCKFHPFVINYILQFFGTFFSLLKVFVDFDVLCRSIASALKKRWKRRFFNYCFLFVLCTSYILTQDGLDRHPEVPLDVPPLVDDCNPVDEGDWVHQVRQVDVSTTHKSEPKMWEFNVNSSYLHN